MERYENLRRIFEVKFFRKSKEKLGTIEEQIAQETETAEQAKRKISADYGKMRKGEYERTREAHTFLNMEKQEAEGKPGSLVKQLIDGKIDSPLRVNTHAKYKLKKKMAEFSLSTHDPHVAPLRIAHPKTNYALRNMVEVKKVRYGSTKEFKEKILPPPKTVRELRMEAKTRHLAPVHQST
jgi:hypothetical protein